MDLGSIFLILALLILVGIFVGRPLFEPKKVFSSPAEFVELDHQRSALLAERDRILNALQELDFDHALGKIPEDDYPGQRKQLVIRGADVLRQLDKLESEEILEAGGAEERLEAAIAARRADTAAMASKKPVNAKFSAEIDSADDELEVLLANRRRARQEKAAGFCHKCGGPVRKSDVFCPKCGAKIG